MHVKALICHDLSLILLARGRYTWWVPPRARASNLLNPGQLLHVDCLLDVDQATLLSVEKWVILA